MRILYLEAFYGGSHRNFADGLIGHSRFKVDLYSLPEKNWKWRVRSGAYHFMEKVSRPEDYDLLFLPGMISLADLKAFWGDRCPPVLLYLHETQLSYPLPPGKGEDYLPLFTELSNALLSDLLVFNSRFHRNSYLQALPGLLDRIPESQPRWVIPKIAEKSRVIYPGIDLSFQDSDSRENKSKGQPTEQEKAKGQGPVILWNHRWDFDKDPEAFFRVLRKIDQGDTPFRLILLGENAQFIPKVFLYAKERYGDSILQFGWAESREEYLGLLGLADIVVSTAIQENFGISVAEAAALGCFPLLPDRLVYPELVPPGLAKKILYQNEEDLLLRLKDLLRNPPPEKEIIGIRNHYLQHLWESRIEEFDSLAEGFTTTDRR